MLKRNTIEVFRRSTLWFLWIWLAFSGAQAFAATSAANTATIAPPAGVTDTVGGCDSATPPNCTGNNTSTATVGVWAVTVVKSANPASGNAVVVGQTITYTLTATVTGGATTADTVLRDTLTGLTFGTVTLAGVYQNPGAGIGNERTFTLPAGTAAGTYSVSYTATVDATASNTVSNVVTGATCGGTCSTTHPVSSVATSKTALPGTGTTVSPGATIAYTLTTTVTGAATPAVITLTDTLSAGLSFTGPVPVGCTISGQQISCTVPVGTTGSVSFNYSAQVAPGTTATSVNNSVVGGGCAVGTPGCSTTHPVGGPTFLKTLASESGTQPGIAEAGEVLTYNITLTNTAGAPYTNYNLTDTLSAGLTYVSSNNGGVNNGQTTTWTGLTVPANGALVVQVVARVDTPITTAVIRNIAKPTGPTDPTCPSTGCVENPTEANVTPVKRLTGESGTQPRMAEAGEVLTYTITLTNTGGTAFTNYRFTENVPLGATLTSVTGASGFAGPVKGAGSVNLQVPSVPASGSAVVTVVFTVADAIPAGVTDLLNLINGGDIDPACTVDCKVSIPVEIPGQLSIIKTSSVREARIGDLVRYTLTVTNIGAVNVVDARVTDTPPAGFSYVADSMAVADGDGAFVLGTSQYPLQIGGIDVAIGRQATITYLLRVGAGVRHGEHVNQAQAANSRGRVISNLATAQVSVVADPLLDESLITGTVFNDRDGDGWQAPASLSGVRVQGGFAPGAYVPNSTSVDRGRGSGPEPQADASAPLLHGISIGAISGRQSEADLRRQLQRRPAAHRQLARHDRLRPAADDRHQQDQQDQQRRYRHLHLHRNESRSEPGADHDRHGGNAGHRHCRAGDHTRRGGHRDRNARRRLHRQQRQRRVHGPQQCGDGPDRQLRQHQQQRAERAGGQCRDECHAPMHLHQHRDSCRSANRQDRQPDRGTNRGCRHLHPDG
jgi:uncharacterized repeat protein (TIGR01451 family)/fimbrial isopeptide formation D2 family protein